MVDADKVGRCSKNPRLHEYDDGHECTRFFSLAFAIDLGLEDPSVLEALNGGK